MIENACVYSFRAHRATVTAAMHMQCKMPAACAWTRGHPISNDIHALDLSEQPVVPRVQNWFRFLLLAPGHGLLAGQAPFSDDCSAEIGTGLFNHSRMHLIYLVTRSTLYHMFACNSPSSFSVRHARYAHVSANRITRYHFVTTISLEAYTLTDAISCYVMSLSLCIRLAGSQAGPVSASRDGEQSEAVPRENFRRTPVPSAAQLMAGMLPASLSQSEINWDSAPAGAQMHQTEVHPAAFMRPAMRALQQASRVN